MVIEEKVVYNNIPPLLRMGKYNVPFIKIDNPKLKVEYRYI